MLALKSVQILDVKECRGRNFQRCYEQGYIGREWIYIASYISWIYLHYLSVLLMSIITSKIVPLALAKRIMAEHETDRENEKIIKKKETQITKPSKLI